MEVYEPEMWLHPDLRVPGPYCLLVDGQLGSGYFSTHSLLKNRKDTEAEKKKVIWESEVANLPSEVDNGVPWHSHPVSSDTHLLLKEVGCSLTSRHALRPISLLLSTDCNSIMS